MPATEQQSNAIPLRRQLSGISEALGNVLDWLEGTRPDRIFNVGQEGLEPSILLV